MSGFHPDLRGAARLLPAGVGRPWLVRLMRRLPIPAARVPAGVVVDERAVADGHPARVRIYHRTADSGPRPVVLWIHGGGYVIGSARQDDGICLRLVEALDVVVVSVDYRLAPQHPYPTPLEDCFAAYDFVHREAAALGVDAARVVVAGQSAGGGLAAALALLIQDRRRPQPVLQLLVSPMLDDRTVLRAVDGRHHRLWDQSSNRFGWTSYLGRAPGGDDVADTAAPARRANLAGLPPAWIGVGTADLFHDEDLDYAARLRAAGVAVDVEVVAGAFHGFDAVLADKPVSRRFFDAQVQAIARALGQSTQPGL